MFKNSVRLTQHKYGEHTKKESSVLQKKLCTLCNGEYIKLKRHILEQHAGFKKEKVLETCMHCGKTTSNLSEHIRYIHDDNPVPCNICGTVMKNRSKLQKHVQKVHQPESKISCSDCGQEYGNKYKLYAHKYAVHSVQKSNCEFCGKTYKNKKLLKAHINHNHRGKGEKSDLSTIY